MQLRFIRYGKISICQAKFSLATSELFSQTLTIDRSNKNISMLCALLLQFENTIQYTKENKIPVN